MKKIVKKQLITLLVILTSFGVLVANAEEDLVAINQVFSDEVQEIVVETEIVLPQLAICDHDHNNVRDLSDVAIFSTCAETFDANNDQVHDLQDIALYSSMNQDENFCNSIFVCSVDSVTPVVPVQEVQQLEICDHNNDEVRNLTDVAMFASCAETFDANNDFVHDLQDIALYASMNQDENFCDNTFVCNATSTPPVVENNQNEATVNGGSDLAICDHNNDNIRNLSDVAIFSSCKDTFDANADGIHDLEDIALYTSNNQSNNFCRDIFNCNPRPEVLTAQVLGEQLKTCNIDADVAGQTNWADGSLIRGCDMKIYRIENQQKHHIASLQDLFRYIGQRIYNVADDIISLF